MLTHISNTLLMVLVALGAVSLSSYQPPPLDPNSIDTRNLIEKMSYSLVYSMGNATDSFISSILNHEALIEEAINQFEALYPQQSGFIDTLERKKTVKCPRNDLSGYYCFAYNPESKSLDMGNLGQAFDLRPDIAGQINAMQSCYQYESVLNMCLYKTTIHKQ